MSTLDTVLCSEDSVESGSHVAKPYEFKTHFFKDTGGRGEGSAYTKIILEQREGPDIFKHRIQCADTSKGM